MSELNIIKKKIQGRRIGNASRFPAIDNPLKQLSYIARENVEGLFLNYGRMLDKLPYTYQDDFDGPMEELEFDAVVLENDFLRAEIVVSLGGRLWALYDKVEKKELLLNNKQFLPGNLALRNAWFAGGVEFNIGQFGHDAQTCSPRFAATLTDDVLKCPVLRIYEFNRDRMTPFQIDFFLPDGSKFLFVRPRIHNQTESVQPMYWWSNAAVPEIEDARLIVPAQEAYTAAYSEGQRLVELLSIPNGEGFDSTYTKNFPVAKDHFYKIPDDVRKYESYIQKDGYGFMHASTKLLKGRKLFVWGQGEGSHHWQRRLIAPDTPDYIEMQAGLAYCQMECIPMPPSTVWEWIEAYGPIHVQPEKIFGDWDTAVDSVTNELDRILPESTLDSLLETTRTSMAEKYAKASFSGSGWGALERILTNKNFDPQLDFGTPGKEQEEWLMLLEKGLMDDNAPESFMVQDQWFELLKKANHNWKTLYHLALNYYRRNDMERALDCIDKSLRFQQNEWNLHALAYFRFEAGRYEESAALFLQIMKMRNDDLSLAKDCTKYLLAMKKYQNILDSFVFLAPQVAESPRLQMNHAMALAYLGYLDEAEQILLKDGGMEIWDVREGEFSTSEIYIYIQQEKAKKNGIILEAEDVDVPYALDLRMHRPAKSNKK